MTAHKQKDIKLGYPNKKSVTFKLLHYIIPPNFGKIHLLAYLMGLDVKITSAKG